jgi:hypothetical protein
MRGFATQGNHTCPQTCPHRVKGAQFVRFKILESLSLQEYERRLASTSDDRENQRPSDYLRRGNAAYVIDSSPIIDETEGEVKAFGGCTGSSVRNGTPGLPLMPDLIQLDRRIPGFCDTSALTGFGFQSAHWRLPPFYSCPYFDIWSRVGIKDIFYLHPRQLSSYRHRRHIL